VNHNGKVVTNFSVKNAVFWDVMPRGSCKNQRFGGMEHLHHKGDKICELGMTLAVTSNQHMLQRNTRATWRNIPKNGILHSHCCENLKAYNF
jgi:hypothetical protein